MYEKAPLCNLLYDINAVQVRRDYYTCRSNNYSFIHNTARSEKEKGRRIQKMLWANANSVAAKPDWMNS